jgi:chemotaxis methyl-accepting protein methylase
VTATDISLPALKKAGEGVYNARRLLDLDQDLVLEYFQQEGGSHFRVKDFVKRRVCFSLANMIDIARSPQRNMDVIYCQNVLIYFRRERVHKILNSLAERLAVGGLLVIGQGEVTDWRHPDVYRVSSNQALAFRRRDDQITH